MYAKMDELLSALRDDGFRIRKDPVHPLMAYKEVETACGPKEVSVCIFIGSPNRVDASYHSEGGNILAGVSWNFSQDPRQALRECDERISESYARKLWLNGIRPREVQAEPHAEAGSAQRQVSP